MKPGSWLIVAGGWNQQQFKENRRPTQAELVAVAPENPVYIQLGYAWAMLTPLAHKALGLTSEADLPGRRPLRARCERRAHRRDYRTPTGDRRALRQAAAADVRRAGPGHHRVFPRAEPARDHRCRRSIRQQHDRRELCGALQGLARQGADRPGRLLAWHAGLRQGVRRDQGDDGAVADGTWRRHAALQRYRRAHYRRHVQQRQAVAGRQGRVLPHRAMGGRARRHADAALEPRRHGGQPAHHLRARQRSACRSRRCAGRSRI